MRPGMSNLLTGTPNGPATSSSSATRAARKCFAVDVDGDGGADIITALDAHGWGLAWFEQVKQNGQISFKKHVIMGTRDEEAKYGVAFTTTPQIGRAHV